ncbi:MAG: hypothetical protein R3F61_28220 [Myxococcota bacterium]
MILFGCGDRCEVLCREVGGKLDACLGDSLSWPDVGARSRADFVDQCRLDWGRTNGDLTSSDLAEALDICRTGSDELAALTCDEMRVLYAP